MSLDEKIRELDEQIASRVKQWLREQHDLLGRKLGEEIARQLDDAGNLLPETLITDEVKAELTAAVGPAPAPENSIAALREAVTAIDQARTQAAALTALLDEGSGFAARLAVFLVRSGEAIGWKSRGFGEAEEAVSSLNLTLEDGGPWHRLAQGKACVRMSAADCARLCSRVESPLPKQGVLIPLVLRDQVAAAIYADQLNESSTLDADALQLLTYSAGLAIETLPFRERSVTTPTLIFESEEKTSGGDGGLSLWGAAGAAAGVAAAAALADATEGASTEMTESAPAAEAADEEAVAEEVETAAEEASVMEEASVTEDESADLEDTPSDTQDVGPIVTKALHDDEEDSPSADAEDEPEALPVEEDVPDYELETFETPQDLAVAGSQEDSETLEEAEVLESSEAFDTPIAFESDAASGETEGDFPLGHEEPEGLAWQEEVEIVEEAEASEVTAGDDIEVWQAEPVAETESADEIPSVPAQEAADYDPPGVDPSALETVEPASEGLQTLHYPVPTEPEASSEEVAAPAEVPGATSDGFPEPDETVLLSRPPSLQPPVEDVPPTPPPAEQPFDGDETHPGLESSAKAPELPPGPAKPGRPSEVAPPSDIDGPGWAFASRAQPASGDEEMHEKAKRLARLLVSEIKLYNEEQVEDGQRNRDIYERLKEDIDRSRQMYEDRVDERVRSTNDYFYQELVRTLASGDPQALGI